LVRRIDQDEVAFGQPRAIAKRVLRYDISRLRNDEKLRVLNRIDSEFDSIKEAAAYREMFENKLDQAGDFTE
jgi:hypothetical protein